MSDARKITRRSVLKSGIVSLGTAAVLPKAHAVQKKPGEVRVLFLMGDIWHNSVRMESHWRKVLGVTGWRLMFAQSSRFVTPEVLADTDLFVFARYAGGDSLGWSPDGIVEERQEGYNFISEEQEKAIWDNVVNRGMGIIPFHCSIWQTDSKKYERLIALKEPLMHGPLMETTFYNLNQEHPITKGVEMYVTIDEIFGAVMMDDVAYTPLMRAVQIHTQPDYLKFDHLAAWAREEGKGRIVMLNCGASHECWWEKSFKEIMWRSAHWAMKKDIPVSGLVDGRFKDRE